MYYNLILYTKTEDKSKFFGIIKTTEIVNKEAIQEIDDNGYVVKYLDLQGNEITLPDVCESNIKQANYKPTF